MPMQISIFFFNNLKIQNGIIKFFHEISNLKLNLENPAFKPCAKSVLKICFLPTQSLLKNQNICSIPPPREAS